MSTKRIVSIVLTLVTAAGAFFGVRFLNDPQRNFRNSGKYAIYETEGQQAPPFEAKVVGQDRSFTSDSIDRPTMFVFFGTFCPHCKDQMPAVRELTARFGDRANIFAVNGREYGDMPPEEREKRVADYLTENSWSDIPTLIAPVAMQSAFKLEAVPTVVMIGPDRTIRYVGLANHPQSRLEALIEEAL